MPKFTAIIVTAVLGVVGIRLVAQELRQDPPQREPARVSVPNPDLADADGRDGSTTALLTIGIDARGVSVLQGRAKPGLEFRAQPRWKNLPFRFTLRDAKGQELAQGGFDPAPMCLDPMHLGQPAHGPGDWLVVHETHTNLRIPDFGAHLHSIDFQVRENDEWRPFGQPISAQAFTIIR